jgi:hypothetical protein
MQTNGVPIAISVVGALFAVNDKNVSAFVGSIQKVEIVRKLQNSNCHSSSLIASW